MLEYYDDIILGIDGVVYAKGEAYRIISNLNIDLDIPFLDNYQPIYELYGEPIPTLKEVLWVTPASYIAVTVDGDLFSFNTGETVHLESPIVSAYVNSIYYDRLVTVLLENGRLRLIYVGDNDPLISINPSDIDIEVPQDIVILSPIDAQFLYSSNKKATIQYSKEFLAVTSDNEFFNITINLEEMIRKRTYRQHNINDHKVYIRIVKIIENDVNLDYRDIKMIRSGYILMNDNRIYNIGVRFEKTSIIYHLQEYEHNVDDVIDLLIQESGPPILLSESGSVHYEDRVIYQSTDSSKPIKFLYRYYLNSDRLITYDKTIFVRRIDGSIYAIEPNGKLIEVLPANSMLSYMGRMTKGYRQVTAV